MVAHNGCQEYWIQHSFFYIFRFFKWNCLTGNRRSRFGEKLQDGQWWTRRLLVLSFQSKTPKRRLLPSPLRNIQIQLNSSDDATLNMKTQDVIHKRFPFKSRDVCSICFVLLAWWSWQRNAFKSILYCSHRRSEKHSEVFRSTQVAQGTSTVTTTVVVQQTKKNVRLILDLLENFLMWLWMVC